MTYPLNPFGKSNIALGYQFVQWTNPLYMATFHSYVKFPEGTSARLSMLLLASDHIDPPRGRSTDLWIDTLDNFQCPLATISILVALWDRLFPWHCNFTYAYDVFTHVNYIWFCLYSVFTHECLRYSFDWHGKPYSYIPCSFHMAAHVSSQWTLNYGLCSCNML